MIRRTPGTRAARTAAAFAAAAVTALLTTVCAVQAATGTTTTQAYVKDPLNPDATTCTVNGWQTESHDCPLP
ncbi:hypothetical protein [Streptomyces sp. KLOTTS4A1]|uniref:hypothetical protein n=1 Tax=Streptomyces sp. KLOTTS4A1 TaxID=3390996 RepID=UPI0039F61D76